MLAAAAAAAAAAMAAEVDSSTLLKELSLLPAA